jgi:hypothetical protein
MKGKDLALEYALPDQRGGLDLSAIQFSDVRSSLVHRGVSESNYT